MLVNDFRTGLAAHGRQPVLRARERLADPQLRGRRGPHGLELDFERLTDHRTVRIILPQIRHDGADGRLRRSERGEPKTGLRLVIIPHTKRGRLARAIVHTTIHPRRALAVDKRKLPVAWRLIVELAVRQRRLGGRVRAGGQRNLVIGHRLPLFAGRKPRGRTVEIDTPRPRTGHAGRPHRQRQYGQRHRCLQDFAGLRRIKKLDAREGFVAQHFEDGHRRPLIGFDIINEDKFFRRRGQIEIVAQRPGAAIEHEGVFLVGVVARQHRVVLVINTALRLQRGQVIGPGIAGQDNFRSRRRPTEFIFAHIGRPIGRLDVRGRRYTRLVPPDFQPIVTGQGVDADNGTALRLFKTHHEGVEVSLGVERGPARLTNITHLTARHVRRENSGPDLHRDRRAAKFSKRRVELGIHPLKPDRISIDITNQGTPHRSAGADGRNKLIGVRKLGMLARRIVLVHQRGAIRRVQLHRRRQSRVERTTVHRITIHAHRPIEDITNIILRPHQAEFTRLHPINENFVARDFSPRRIERRRLGHGEEAALGRPRHGVLIEERLRHADIGQTRHHAMTQGTLVIRRHQLIAEAHPLHHRPRLLGHFDNFRTELFARHAIGLERPKEFDKYPALQVIGMESVIGRVKPAGAFFRRRRGVFHRIRHFAGPHKRRRHRGGKERVIDHIHRGYARRGNLDYRTFKAVFRPVDLLHRLNRRRRDHVLFRDFRLREPFDPGNVHDSRLGRENLLGVRAVIIPLARRIFGCREIKRAQLHRAQRPAIHRKHGRKDDRPESIGNPPRRQRGGHRDVFDLHTLSRDGLTVKGRDTLG